MFEAQIVRGGRRGGGAREDEVKGRSIVVRVQEEEEEGLEGGEARVVEREDCCQLSLSSSFTSPRLTAHRHSCS